MFFFLHIFTEKNFLKFQELIFSLILIPYQVKQIVFLAVLIMVIIVHVFQRVLSSLHEVRSLTGRRNYALQNKTQQFLHSIQQTKKEEK